ncbi:MAG: MurR/RpiR family transcriptional regulator [Erysipelotrichaceae bacterium]|nr:MurR/RpiR family transcriptional regulator [Erysipelotrichaceae bacterium]
MLLLDKLKDKSQFSSLDLAIVDYVLDHPKEVTDLTVEELAKVTFTSPSSIVRLCKKLGMKGYADFRIKLAIEINTFLINEERIEVDMPVAPNASFDDIAKTFLNLHYQALLDTYNILDKDAIMQAADLIYKSDYIETRGVGPSFIIAEDFAYKLGKIGLPVISRPFTGYDTFIKIRKAKLPVAIIVSNYGVGGFIKDWIKILKTNECKIIMICSNKNSISFKQADIKILIEANEKDKVNKMGSFASRTAMQYVLDLIYSIIFSKEYIMNVKLQYQHGETIKSLDRNKEEKKF